jgi:hypothetical protein
VGEPVSSFRAILQWSTGGSLMEGSYIREMDLDIDYANVLQMNAGLSFHVFQFSYQLAIAVTILIAFLILNKESAKKAHYFWGLFILIILLLTMITNTERATILSVSVSIFFLLLISLKKSIRLFIFSILILCVLSSLSFLLFSLDWGQKYTTHSRMMEIKKENIITRTITIPFAAAYSVISEPLGSGRRYSKHFNDTAIKYGWFNSRGMIEAPHNHFANIIMYSGIIGLFLVSTLFIAFINKVILVLRMTHSDTLRMLLVLSCITATIHSLTHNAGFFRLEATTLIVFSLLWGTTDKETLSRYDKP